MDTTTQAQRLFSTDQLAEVLGVTLSTIYKWRQKGEFPTSIRLPNGQLRVMQDDLDAWLLARRQSN